MPQKIHEQLGDLQLAQNILAEAASGVRAMENVKIRDFVLALACDMRRVRAGDMESALASANSRSTAGKQQQHSGICGKSAGTEAGDIEGALATARSITSKNIFAVALRNIAIAQAESGDFDDALARVRSIDAWTMRAIAFMPWCTIAGTCGSGPGICRGCGRPAPWPWPPSRTLKMQWSRTNALQNIARTQLQAGDLQGAGGTLALTVAAADGIDDAKSRASKVAAGPRNDKAKTNGLRSSAEAHLPGPWPSPQILRMSKTEPKGWPGLPELRVLAGDTGGALTISSEHMMMCNSDTGRWGRLHWRKRGAGTLRAHWPRRRYIEDDLARASAMHSIAHGSR